MLRHIGCCLKMVEPTTPRLSVGGSLILHCNFDTAKLKTQFPKYYKECFDAWSGLNSRTPVTFNDVMNEIIWNNRFICIDKKSVY